MSTKFWEQTNPLLAGKRMIRAIQDTFYEIDTSVLILISDRNETY